MTTISARVKVADSVSRTIPNHLNQNMATFENSITAVQSFSKTENGSAIYQKPMNNPVR